MIVHSALLNNIQHIKLCFKIDEITQLSSQRRINSKPGLQSLEFLPSHFMQTTFFVTCSVTESSSVTEHVTLMPQVAVTIISRLGQDILGTKVPPFFSYLSQGLLTQLLSLHCGICTHTA